MVHTRLVRVTEVLREEDPLRMLNRITLLAEGFGGGRRIGDALEPFARTFARQFVDGRAVVMILSDGHDSGPPDMLAAAMARLARHGCRIVWLKPLKGWRAYAPLAAGMAAARPCLDLFAPAATLDDLAGRFDMHRVLAAPGLGAELGAELGVELGARAPMAWWISERTVSRWRPGSRATRRRRGQAGAG